MIELAKPTNWADKDGWENYYAQLINSEDLLDVSWNTGSISVDRIQQLVDKLKESSYKTIWVPGCGVSLLPKLLCRAGMNVRATDISQSAIDFQRDNESPRANDLIAKSGIEESVGGTLTAEVHDFQQDYITEYFDFVINVKAIQGFESVSN